MLRIFVIRVYGASAKVRLEMVDFGSGQGRSDFETAGVGWATSRISKSGERRPGPKDAVSRQTF